VALWLIAGGLALAWNSRVAAHLVALAALPWWIAAALQSENVLVPGFVLASGAALLSGGGLVLAALRWQRLSACGHILSIYGVFSLACAATLQWVFGLYTSIANQPPWAIACGVAGVIFAFAAAAMTRRPGTALGGIAIGLVLVAATELVSSRGGEPWFNYAVELGAMVCLLVSGMLDENRPRIVAGWLGTAGVIVAITWGVGGSLLRRSAFFAAAGALAVTLAIALNRLLPRARE